MRILTWVVVLLTALYSGYWFVAAKAAREGAETALAEAGARGIEVQHQGLDLTGFPSRFDLTLTEPKVSGDGWRWQAPFAQVFALSYSPWKLISALPNTQRLEVAGQGIEIASTRMQASLFLRPETALPLDRFDAVVEGASLRGEAGWALGFASANASLIAQEGGAQAAFRMLEIVPDQRLTAALNGALPATVARVDLLADLGLSQPLGLRAAPAELTLITLREAHLVWGPLKLTVAGELVPDPQGRAEGTLDLRVEGWQQGLAAAEAAGVVPERFRVVLRSMLENLAAQSDEPGVLKLPLVMAQGQMRLGPLPLGPAPRLR
ncbi:MAG: DUF2125 domain-containing protein [Gemmobacter sp.]|uniref:DUF2125 domain-containing protein n=1 Tax=Gemmobacter sp. TaxID=1898957 RepID=UPI001A3DDF4B|nr:DUF2125 domain-containing protein [Gemmobacter sp.]MBL8562009.1 DUF2125 domain-containing protein [Gemmobacter sp.]